MLKHVIAFAVERRSMVLMLLKRILIPPRP